ncbi:MULTISPECIES: L,D-transpeptidase family protein [unclassified Mycobacterium]|uniref:L,D-transpeptidase family protein n=1 Tax=unclassified Mycobacterium TaxID=2642494 RepID=UPI0029C70E1D|nr:MULTISPECIES: L,D-transpeptidase family protein [unclassified Mycobacterium]
MRRLLTLLCAAAVWFTAAPIAQAELIPWFANQVGNATQVISVVGVGGSDAKVDVYERTSAGWQAVVAGVPAKIGEKGMSPEHFDGSMLTPMGIYTLDFAFGTQPNPGGGLQYVQVGPNHWWDGDMKSPTYNLMQVCEKSQCPFSTALSDGTENLDIPQYAHAVVMGVNKERIPGKGGAFFLHTTDGGPTAGCVAIGDAMMVKLIQWLRPGALIAVSK